MVRRFSLILLLIPYGIWFCFLILGPLIGIFRGSFQTREQVGGLGTQWTTVAYETLLSPLYAGVFTRTMAMATGTTVLSILLAFPIAYAISRVEGPKRNIWFSLILVPFWTNFLVRIFAFQDILRVKPFGLDLNYTPTGVLLCMVYNYFPLAFFPLFSAFEKLDKSLIEAASDLGASSAQRLRHVILPFAMPGIRNAALFVFVPSLGEYLIPDLIGGGRYFVLGTFLQNQFLSARNWPLGSAAVALLILMTTVGLLIVRAKDSGRAEIQGGTL